MIERRYHYKGEFTRLPNITLDDRNLEADALGVLCYLLGKALNWQINVRNIRTRFKMGRNRAYAILAELEEAGYIQRGQSRNAEQQFGPSECVVFDTSEKAQATRATVVNIDGTPLPQNRDTAPSEPLPEMEDTPATAEAVSPKAVSPKRGRIIRNKIINPPSEGLTPREGALEEKKTGSTASPPSQPATLNAKVWAEAKAILSPKEFGCIAEWLKRVKDRPKGLETLLGIIQTAQKQGTGQPVPYITAALNREFPPPPDPKTFTPDRWKLAAQAATNTGDWPISWGPRPGERGCLMPADFITPELTRAISFRRAA